jgi:hypothetical protein
MQFSRYRPVLALGAAALLPLAACAELEEFFGEETPAGPVRGDGTQVSAEFSEQMPFTVVVDGGELVAMIEALPVAEESNDGYDRSLFPHWKDESRNGCNARHETLLAEDRSGSLTADDCGADMAGEWVSMFDGEVLTEASAIDIDHVVPLKEAWGSGAHAWSTERRQDFANSLDQPWHLLAVTASSNRSKGDKDPAEWMPPNAAVWCEYLWIWTAIKTDWELSVDQAERDAMLAYAADC